MLLQRRPSPSVLLRQAILKHYLDMALDDIGCRDSQCHSFREGYKDWKAAAAAKAPAA